MGIIQLSNRFDKTDSTVVMVTITDIAAKAGVARSTVSCVLNERNTTVKVSVATRQRVLDAARELGYQRNELARVVTTGKNSVLGFWVTNSQREPDVRILSGAMKEAEANNYFIKMLSLDSSGDAAQIAEHCINWRLSGVIAINPSSDDLDCVQPHISRFGIPLVMVEGEGPRSGCLYVTSEQEQGIADAVRHLASLGHHKIAFLGGKPPADKREQAYWDTMQELNLKSYAEVVYTSWNFPTAHQAALSLLQREISQRPSAICCVCDHVAMILLSAAGQLGLRVPQDLAVTGFDDLAVSSIYNPPLTTVRQPFEDMGRLAVRRLLETLEDGSELREESSTPTSLADSLPTQLMIRGSTVAASPTELKEFMLDTEIQTLSASLLRVPTAMSPRCN